MAAVDTFSGYASTITAPADHAFAITPSDSTDLAYVTREIFVGTGGTVTVTTKGGETVQYTVPTGGKITVRVTRVWATGTSALALVGEY